MCSVCVQSVFCLSSVCVLSLFSLCSVCVLSLTSAVVKFKYIVILSVLDPRKCKYLKDYSLEFEHAYMTTYLAS